MLLTLLMTLGSPALWAHAEGFATTAIDLHPTDPDEVWAVVDGWGVVHTTDGGAQWRWLCEEALGASAYDVAATGAGQAWVAVLEGLVFVEDTDRDACGLSRPAGWPTGLWPFRVVPSGTGVVAAGTGGGQDGLWHCTTSAGCAPVLVEASMLPRSLQADGERLWATLVDTVTLQASLYASEDGQDWQPVHHWTDGDSDPRLLFVDGERILLWSRPFQEGSLPTLQLSEDGGQSFTIVLESGQITDPVPGFLALPGGGYLLSAWSAATAHASVDGVTWEVVTDPPAFRCGRTVGTKSWVCPTRLDPGWELATTVDGVTFQPAACLDEATAATCVAETCTPWQDALHEAAALGGGYCNPAPDTGIDTGTEPPPAETEDGCEGRDHHAIILMMGALLAGYPRRSRRTF